MRRRRDPLLIHNERMKLLAGFLNAIALGFVGFSFLRPLVEGTVAFDTTLAIWIGTGLVLHVLAHYILGYLEKEVSDDDL